MTTGTSKPFSIIFLLLASILGTVISEPTANKSGDQFLANQTFKTFKHKRLRTYLRKINKPAVKTVQSPDGDLIDCVVSHLQPAFDHPHLKGMKPLEPPKRPIENATTESSFQLWTVSGESCPKGTVPIRTTTEKDVIRASTFQRFGRKIIRRDIMSSDHEHAVAFLWVISGTFGDDLNSIEAGWQVSPELYGDIYPRFFTYWTSDAYQTTGCYNLLCSGFVQTNNKIAMGAAISPTSLVNNRQLDIDVMIWKDPKHGHWWLELGSGLLVGYWPSFLFSHLQNHASMIQFGGEIVNSRSMGFHTSTQMGSGHFADEGFGKASYFRNLQLVDWDNNLIPLSNLQLLADNPNCYDIKAGKNNIWGDYFYYGGPGRNSRCP
ncbi:hypothetical protein A4A49_32922 [Nicotiana attenuata]|uniref:Neprosin PEP catalytic domain-containing protein n=1 Tax=Nicotiana attenuata TaxID=49451 RepID=A0A1J6IAX2_NICAT|nr:hypothetical protein A4A49_32922 [Nicotiana attenuata]